MVGGRLSLKLFVVVIVCACWIVPSTSNRIRHQKHEEENDPFLTEEISPEVINGDIIDLDDTNFELASIDRKQNKNAEDTREPGVARHKTKNHILNDDSDDIPITDTDILSPIPLISDTEGGSDVINVTLPFNTSDDEDIASGSGSGDIVIEIEEGDDIHNTTTSPSFQEIIEADNTDDTSENEPDDTESYEDIDDDDDDDDDDEDAILFGGKPSHFYEYDSEDVEYIENKTDVVNESEDQGDQPMYCQELFNVTWTPWSPWIQAGDVDIRFRSCPIKHGYKSSELSCKGDYFEIRKCGSRDERSCRTPEGTLTEEYKTQCTGIVLDDLRSIDDMRNPAGPADECEFTLYDLKYNMAIGQPLSSDQLHGADPTMWCFSDDKFVPFYTPIERCRNILRSFCKDSKKCKYEKPSKTQKDKGDLHRRCWTDFVLGGLLPKGFPLRNGQQMICQKYDKDSKLSEMFDHKTSQFATMYDTKQRIPVYSMVTVRSLGDDKWPSLPFMIDRGFIKEEVNTISWFFKEKKRGITRIADLSTDDCGVTSCKHGDRQALPSDYDLSGFMIAPLLTPDVIGWDLSRRVSAFTMTNTAPMEPTVYPGWKRIMKAIREFAINECHIPVNAENYGKGKPHNGRELPELYLIAGSAPSMANSMEVIGNDVIVPEMFWVSACCAHGAAVSSFGVYVYNTFEQKPAAVSVENLQMLLQANYYDNVDVININLYPAFDQVCSAPENDVSFKIDLK